VSLEVSFSSEAELPDSIFSLSSTFNVVEIIIRLDPSKVSMATEETSTFFSHPVT
jgi:hypothetical protein